MLPLDHPDRIQITFDDHRLVANAGLILPTTLARHLGLPQLVQECLDLGNAPGRANTGDKIMTLVASALAGGDCIDDADVLRTGGTARTLGGTVKAPSTLGTFLRSFRWGHVRQLDRVSRELLARAWAAGAGPGDTPLTIDLDSTICETYGLAKEGARHHSYTGQRGYHPLLAIAAGTGDVLMSVVGTQPSQDAKCLALGHLVTARVRNRTHFLERGVGIHTVEPGQVNPRHTVQVRPNVEAWQRFTLHASPAGLRSWKITIAVILETLQLGFNLPVALRNLILREPVHAPGPGSSSKMCSSRQSALQRLAQSSHRRP